MLKKLILENWKSFRYAELPLDPLTVLIGTNASGKSNVVEALEFLQRIANGENLETALAGDKTLPSIRGGVELAARKGENEFSLKVLVGGEDDDNFLYILRIKTLPNCRMLEEYIESDISDHKDESFLKRFTLRIGHHDRSNLLNYDTMSFSDLIFDLDYNHIICDFDYNDQVMPEVMGEEFKNIYLPTRKRAKKSITSNLENILLINPIPSTMRGYSRLSENLETDASNIAGVLAALPDNKKAEVENILSEYIKYLPEGDIKKVWAEPIGRLKTDAMLYCQEEWKSGEIIEIDARSMSDGTLRFLAILTALLTRPEGSQIVIEEIDNGLHPSRAALLVKILKEIGTKRNIDILLTTHNPALLDAFGSEIVPFVVVAHRDSETGESKLTLLEDIDNFPKLFASYSLGQMTTKGAIERSLSHGE
ncbi:MAG: AAA family ATPase [Dolichospermum sp. JUN01]|nr:AAA family ATPase [Dolichospermum sp. JUN01]